MSLLITKVGDSKGNPAENVTLSSDFYVEYSNSDTGKTLTSGVLLSTNATSDNKGDVNFNITTLTGSREFTKYWELFLSEGSSGKFFILGKTTTYPNETYLSVTVETAYDLGKYEANVNFDGKTGTYTFPDIEASDFVTLVNLGDSKYSLDTLETNYKAAEKSYLLAKNLYQQNLKITDTSKIFERLTAYEPTSWNTVLTRLLEFEEGTLNSGLRFAKKAGLTEEYRRLDVISTSILYLKNLYPNILITDGEGIPYNK